MINQIKNQIYKLFSTKNKLSVIYYMTQISLFFAETDKNTFIKCWLLIPTGNHSPQTQGGL